MNNRGRTAINKLRYSKVTKSRNQERSEPFETRNCRARQIGCYIYEVQWGHELKVGCLQKNTITRENRNGLQKYFINRTNERRGEDDGENMKMMKTIRNGKRVGVVEK